MSEKTYELQEGAVIIFKNKQKTKDSQPEYTGKINFNGEIRDIALWVKKSPKGVMYFSGTHSAPYVKPDASTAQPQYGNQPEPPDEDLPF